MADLYCVDAGARVKDGPPEQGFVVLYAQMWQKSPAREEEEKAREPRGWQTARFMSVRVHGFVGWPKK
jgi:hypothetical protein